MREFLIAIDADLVDGNDVYDCLTSNSSVAPGIAVHVRSVENGTMAALDINEEHGKRRVLVDNKWVEPTDEFNAILDSIEDELNREKEKGEK